MTESVFLWVLGAVLTGYLAWGFGALPGEKGQILAAIPFKKTSGDLWEGLNITGYGLLIANAVVFASALYFLLMAGMGIPNDISLLFLTIVMVPALPSARWIARWVEGKPNTFTTAGAYFTGLLLAPAGLWGLKSIDNDLFAPGLELIPVLAVMSTCYCFGEGLGRLACISFGCCYGKPLHRLPAMLQKPFARASFVYFGKIKKIVYAEGWEGVPIFPIQAVTAMVLVSSGMAGMFFLLSGNIPAAFWTTIWVSQGWRMASEYFRCDERGGGRWSAYQWSSLCAMVYAGGLFALSAPPPLVAVDLLRGLNSFWNPGGILLLEILWLIVFLYMGRSRVTGSSISLFVRREGI